MALTFLPAAQANLAVDAIFPIANRVRTATATNGTTTLTFGDVAGIVLGMTVTGTGITSGGVVTGVNQSTNVVTITGTITTLTTSVYTFTLSISSSLHTATPGTTGASEVTGGSYARQSTTYGTGANGVQTSTNAQNFVSMPSVTVTHFGQWTAVSSGTYCGGGPLTSSLTVPSGATVAAAIGALTVGVTG